MNPWHPGLGIGWKVHHQSYKLAEKCIWQALRKKKKKKGCAEGQRRGQGQGATLSSRPKMKKGLWSPEEDAKLINYMMKIDLGSSWSCVAKQVGLQRCGKSCRLRWINYLRPGLKHGAISDQEEQLIIELHSILGNRWSQIAAHMPGRTDNEIKNYWHSCIKKKINRLPCSSSSTQVNYNINTKPKSHICNTNSESSHAYKSFDPAKPEGYLQSFDNTFNVSTSTENHNYCLQGVLDLNHEQVQEQNFVFDPDSTNKQLISCSQLRIDTISDTNESFSQSFASPNLQMQGHTYRIPEPSRSQQLKDSSTPLPPHEAPGFANNALDCIITIPALFDISDSLKENIENDGHMINEIENEIMRDYSLCTASSGITSWSSNHFYSNAADFTDVYPRTYTTNNMEDSMNLKQKTTHQPCQPHSSRSQFRAPAIIWADIDQYLNTQAQGQDDCKDNVNLRYDKLNLNVPTYIKIHRQKNYQLTNIGGVNDDDQLDCLTIPNDEGKATPTPTILGKGSESKTIDFQCESESGQVSVWAQDNHICSIHTDTAAVSDLHQICFK